MHAHHRESVGAAGWKNTADTQNMDTGVEKVRTIKQACWGDMVEEHRKRARDTILFTCNMNLMLQYIWRSFVGFVYCNGRAGNPRSGSQPPLAHPACLMRQWHPGRVSDTHLLVGL